MDRRNFLISGSIMAAMAMTPLSVGAATTALPSAHDTTRLTALALAKMGITFPKTQTTAPGGHHVEFTLQPGVARQYHDQIYVWFENEAVLRTYDDSGSLVSQLDLPSNVLPVRDFAVDTSGNVYVITVGKHQVVGLTPGGGEIGRIGRFGIESEARLNGPASLTVDDAGNLHVLNLGTRTVKVYSADGQYLQQYGQSRWGKDRALHSIDGHSQIVLTGGAHNDNAWQFTTRGQLLASH